LKKCKFIFSLIIILLGFVMVACSNETIEPGLYTIGNSEFYEIVNSDSEDGYWVYIGRPTCQYCRMVEPIIESALYHLDARMYYFNTDVARYEDEAKMLSLVNPLQIEGIPIIVHLVNGQVATYKIGVYTQGEIVDFLQSNGFVYN